MRVEVWNAWVHVNREVLLKTMREANIPGRVEYSKPSHMQTGPV